jgi:alpha,alpha-trehalase
MGFGAVRMSRVSPSRRVWLVLIAAIALSANQFPATPSELYGELFVQVQEQRIFGDNKTFVDAVPLREPDRIMADYRAAPPPDAEALRQFVLANFNVPGITPTEPLPLRDHIRGLWPDLVRQPGREVEGGSLIALPLPYVVPGGRFREIYYWDSYFTMEGLRADGETALVDNMIDDFVSLIERYGHVPNGTRTYYVSRSQPPFFALTLDLSDQRDPATTARRLAALRTE